MNHFHDCRAARECSTRLCCGKRKLRVVKLDYSMISQASADVTVELKAFLCFAQSAPNSRSALQAFRPRTLEHRMPVLSVSRTSYHGSLPTGRSLWPYSAFRTSRSTPCPFSMPWNAVRSSSAERLQPQVGPKWRSSEHGPRIPLVQYSNSGYKMYK